MLDFLPVWIKALIGSGLMVFIGINGFRLTSNNSKSDNSDKDDSNK